MADDGNPTRFRTAEGRAMNSAATNLLTIVRARLRGPVPDRMEKALKALQEALDAHAPKTRLIPVATELIAALRNPGNLPPPVVLDACEALENALTETP